MDCLSSGSFSVVGAGAVLGVGAVDDAMAAAVCWGSDFYQFCNRPQFAQFGKVVSGCLAVQVAAQDDGFAAKETLHAFGVVYSKEFGKARLDPLRVFCPAGFRP